MVVLFQSERFVPSYVNRERAVGVLCTGDERPLFSKKCFPAYFLKSTEYRPKNVTGCAWLHTESAAGLHLVIGQT